jgi:hypothetical protein
VIVQTLPFKTALKGRSESIEALPYTGISTASATASATVALGTNPCWGTTPRGESVWDKADSIANKQKEKVAIHFIRFMAIKKFDTGHTVSVPQALRFKEARLSHRTTSSLKKTGNQQPRVIPGYRGNTAMMGQQSAQEELFYRFGKFCIIAERRVNIGHCTMQESVA